MGAVADPARRTSPEQPPVRRLSLQRRVAFWGFATLLVLAVVFYLWWGLTFGVWIDNGVYAVVVVLATFGLAGMWLVLPNPPIPESAKIP